MDSPYTDCTTVFRIKKNFNQFLSSGIKTQQQQQQKSQNLSANSSAATRLTFDDSQMDDSSRQPVTMQSLLERKNEETMKRADFLKTKAKVADLESKIEALTKRHRHEKIDMEKELAAARDEKQRGLDRDSQLKLTLRSAMSKKELAEEQLKHCTSELSTVRTTYEQRLSSLMKDKLQSESKFAETEHNLQGQIMQLKNETVRQAAELEICKVDLAQVRQQLEASLRNNTEANDRIQEMMDEHLEDLKAKNKVKELEQKIQRMDEDATITKLMKSQLDRFPELEKENRRLRDENQYCKNTQENTYLLKEELENVKQKFERAKYRCAEFEQLQIEHQELQVRLKKWEAEVGGSGKKPMSPEVLTRQVTELQKTNVMLLEKQGQLQTSLHSAENRLRVTEEKLRAATGKQANNTHENQSQSDLIKRLQRKLLLVTKERDGFRQILESYENEATVSFKTMDTSRIRQLEETVDGYRRQMSQLEQELDKTKEQLAESVSRAHLLETLKQPNVSSSGTSDIDQKIILDLREKVAALEKELETVVEEKEILEARIEQSHIQGDYDSSKVKIVSFKMNPAAIAQQERAKEVTKLKEENVRLAERVKILEEKGAGVGNLTMMVDEKIAEPGSSSEVEELKNKLSSADLRYQRLQEAFSKVGKDIREACYQLFGYRMDILGGNQQYRVSSMYADSPNDYLLFKQNSKGEFQILGTDYSESLMEKVEEYLQTGHSFPAFLASITLDQYSRQTLMATMMQ